jgi:acyl-coenzyme A synthetase/AMP-(fatty) acid ligase
VLERGFAFPAKTLQLFQSEKVTGFAGVATTFSRLLQIPELATTQLPHLRYLTCAGGPLLPAQYARLRSALPEVKIFPMYGMTECARIAYSPSQIAEQNPAALAQTVTNLSAWIVDDTGNPVKTGVTGELVVRSSFIAYGYWRNVEATAEKFKTGDYFNDQILYTGDYFRQDEQGYFYFVGRKDEILKSGGEKVAPIEIENVLLELPEVHEVCVVGVEDADLGEAVAALLVLKEGATLSEKQIQQHCRKARLEQIKIPKFIRFVSELPKSHNGKILRRQARLLQHPNLENAP